MVACCRAGGTVERVWRAAFPTVCTKRIINVLQTHSRSRRDHVLQWGAQRVVQHRCPVLSLLTSSERIFSSPPLPVQHPQLLVHIILTLRGVVRAKRLRELPSGGERAVLLRPSGDQSFRGERLRHLPQRGAAGSVLKTRHTIDGSHTLSLTGHLFFLKKQSTELRGGGKKTW
jgi:hypothetical protein